MLKVSREAVKAIEDLIASGDVSVASLRKKFSYVAHRTTLLDDENMIKAAAAQEDDDDEELMRNVMAIEHGQYTMVD